MTCCPTESDDGWPAKSEAVANEISVGQCVNCKAHSAPISRKTLLLMLMPHLLEAAMTGKYRFCSTPDCPIVYFEEHGDQKFTVEDLRSRVGIKASGDPIPLCYCFGFDESHIRDDLSRTGTTTIPEKFHGLSAKAFALARRATQQECAAWER